MREDKKINLLIHTPSYLTTSNLRYKINNVISSSHQRTRWAYRVKTFRINKSTFQSWVFMVFFFFEVIHLILCIHHMSHQASNKFSLKWFYRSSRNCFFPTIQVSHFFIEFSIFSFHSAFLGTEESQELNREWLFISLSLIRTYIHISRVILYT